MDPSTAARSAPAYCASSGSTASPALVSASASTEPLSGPTGFSAFPAVCQDARPRYRRFPPPARRPARPAISWAWPVTKHSRQLICRGPHLLGWIVVVGYNLRTSDTSGGPLLLPPPAILTDRAGRGLVCNCRQRSHDPFCQSTLPSFEVVAAGAQAWGGEPKYFCGGYRACKRKQLFCNWRRTC